MNTSQFAHYIVYGGSRDNSSVPGVGFELSVRAPAGVWGRQVGVQVCDSGERSEVQAPACGWHPKHRFSSCF